MRRFLVVLLSAVLLTGGLFTYRTIDACRAWQGRYKVFLYTEMLKMSPVIYTPKMIEALIGPRPPWCTRPADSLSNEDLRRFRRERIGPNFFTTSRLMTPLTIIGVAAG